MRSVPFEVRSDQVAQYDPFAGLRELEKLCGGRDLVLRKTMPVEGIEGAVYHPLSPVYVPSFLGQGIPITSVAIELADDSVPCNHNTHDAKTAPGGSRLWVSKEFDTGKKWILRLGHTWVYNRAVSTAMGVTNKFTVDELPERGLKRPGVSVWSPNQMERRFAHDVHTAKYLKRPCSRRIGASFKALASRNAIKTFEMPSWPD